MGSLRKLINYLAIQIIRVQFCSNQINNPLEAMLRIFLLHQEVRNIIMKKGHMVTPTLLISRFPKKKEVCSTVIKHSKTSQLMRKMMIFQH
uniref:Uncharacterized protein n=1 Tax=Arundo donax TaxID=35708 RepID=A0A0A9E2F3_ARUDO